MPTYPNQIAPLAAFADPPVDLSTLTDLGTTAGIAAGCAVFLLGGMIFYKYLLHIARPNQALVFSGRSASTKDGASVGYRV